MMTSMDAPAMDRAVTRIAHEIVERHPDPEPLMLVGMRTRGVPLARAPVDANRRH